MDHPKISVIVPIYNVKPYLAQCLESILGQTLEDVQVIAVDDGSTDGEGVILDEFSANDQRVTAIHKDNGGISSARNAGLPLVRGDYFTFVDSDDWIDQDMYEKLTAALDETGADVASSDSSLTHRLVITDGIVERYLRDGDVLSTNRVFRTETLLSGFKFDSGDVAIDVKGTYDLMRKASSWVIVPGAFYNLRQDNVSYGRSPFKELDLNTVRLNEMILEDCRGVSQEAVELELDHLTHAKISCLSKGIMFGFKSSEDEEVYRAVITPFQRDIRQRLLASLRSGYFSRNEKAKILLASLSYPLFSLVTRIYMRHFKGINTAPFAKC